MLKQKMIEMEFVRRRQRAATLENARRRQLQLFAGRFERLPFEAVLVRRIEQGRHQRLERFRQTAGHEFVDVTLLLLGEQALFLDAGQRRLQRLGRRRLVASLALLVEIHRRAVQPQQQAGGFHCNRCVAEVFAAQLVEIEFVAAAAFPHEIDIDRVGAFLRRVHEGRQRGLVEAQQYRRSLDLGTLAVRRFNLQRAVVVGENGADLEAAVLFVKYIHGETASRRRERRGL